MIATGRIDFLHRRQEAPRDTAVVEGHRMMIQMTTPTTVTDPVGSDEMIHRTDPDDSEIRVIGHRLDRHHGRKNKDA